MTEPTTQSAVPGATRVRTLAHGIMQVLIEHPEGLQVKDVIKELRLIVPPTPEELTLNASGYERFDTNARWWSVGLAKAEWITKVNGVWKVTEKGKRAFVDFPGVKALGEEVDRLYAEWKAKDTAEKVSKEDWSQADQILARIPLGRWVSAGDLGKVAGYAPTSVGIHVWKELPARWHVVLRQTGEIPADIYGIEDRAEEQHALLAAEGITADPAASADQRIALEELEALAADLVFARGAWLVRGTSVKGGSIVDEWLAQGFVSIPASRLPKLPDAPDDAAIEAAVQLGYDSIGYSQREAKTEEVRAFVRRMRPGDLVVTASGQDVYVGRVTGAVEQIDSPGLRSNLRRDTDWQNSDTPIEMSMLPSRLDGRMRSSADIVDLSDVYDDISALLDIEEGGGAGATVALPDLSPDVVEQLLIDPSWLAEFVELLRERRQVILYGPPGTGKTYLAQAVAEALGGKGHVTLVQFHPSYSYEDFFEGYRPATSKDGAVSLQLVPGPLRKVVDLARGNSTEPYFLIVDEINRANLAKVFGELYFLLEYRDRTIDLLYSSGDSGPAFSLPDNVFIVGTMNTADRSIALVDAAMRRRFAFLSLHPEDERLDLVLRAWLKDRSLPEDRADLLVELNKRIGDKDFKVGPSYLMSSTVATDAGLDRIWRTSILPLLEEHHVGDGVDVKAKYGLPALRRALSSSEAASAE